MKRAARLFLLCALAACGGDDKPAPDADGGSDAARPEPKDTGADDEDAGAPAPAQTSRVCSPDGMCWELPSPQGQTLRSVWAAGPDALWAVGDGGAVVRYDATGWSAAHTPVKHDLYAIHGSSPRDLWAVGKGGSILHFDGEGWSAEDVSGLIDASGGAMTGVLNGVFALAPDAVWAVGHSGASAIVIHYDGERWSNQVLATATPQVLRAIWGVSADKLWAVGDAGVIRSFDGTQWIADRSPTGAALHSVHALVAHDVWAVGANGVAVRWNGTTWANANAGLTGVLYSVRVDIGAAPPVMDAGVPMMPPPPMDAGSEPPPPPQGPWSVWAFGEKGRAFRYNGTLWAAMASGTELSLLAAARVAEKTLVAVGQHGQITRFSGDARQNLSAGSRRNHLGLWSDGATVWSVGDEIVRRDARGWTAIANPNERALYAIWGDPSGAWAVGTGGSIARYEQGSWQARTVSSAADVFLHGVWGAGSSVWIVGDSGTALIAAAGSFLKIPTPVRTHLLDVWGAADDRFWAVGDAGVVLRWDGMAWLKVPTGPMGGTTKNLRAVWGSGPDDVWVVGNEGTILRWNGTRFVDFSREAGFSLNDVWGRTKDEVYAVGSGGVVLRWDGGEWRELVSGTTGTLTSVVGDAAGRVFVGGLDGVMLVLGERS